MRSTKHAGEILYNNQSTWYCFKEKRMRYTFAILMCACMLNASAQFPTVDIAGSQVRKIKSSIVGGQEYVLHMMLPSGYSNSNKKYPVVYLMDSQWDFPLVKCIYGEHYFDGFIPEMIIVGVTWGGVNPNPDSLRARDYTPSHESRVPQSGGADKFLSFMRNELFPFVEKNYRADTSKRSLMGCSLGGLFTLYALLTHTDMFNGYAAASPAVGWDNEILYQYEKDFGNKQLKNPVRVYMTVGDVERGRTVFEKMAGYLINKHYYAVSIQSKVLENTGHSGTKGETFARGLQYIFEKPKVKLDDAALNQYAGKYQFDNGTTVELKNENNHLVFYFNPNFKYDLFAASSNEFYSTTEFFNLYFQNENGQLTGFELATYNNNQILKKVN
jgi:predicted alpha/beta superfamily hydrolase